MEAILDAKRQACEKAGLKIESKTTVENFKLKFDCVETEAASVLLPGFQVIDVGYMSDSTYSVVRVGRSKLTKASSSGSALYTVLLWFSDRKPASTTRQQLLDRLYEWLSSIHGDIKVDAAPVDELEDSLVSIMKYDSSLCSGKRYYAFTYRLPLGTVTYTQRTPSSGGSSDYNFKTKLRGAQSYIMQVAACNAVYFEKPVVFNDTIRHPHQGCVYPRDFKTVFSR